MAEKRKVGRPSSYTPAIAAVICERLAAGESMRAICETEGIPDRKTVLRWLQSNPEFATKCARAWDMQADTLADQQLEVANQVLSGEIDPQAGKVAVSVMQWLASKRAPKRYGDRLELAGDRENPIQTRVVIEVVDSAQKVIE